MRLPTPLRLISVSGEILKDEGIKLSLSGVDPLVRAHWDQTVYDLHMGWKGISEEIRLMCEAAGFYAPKGKSGWWGSMTSASIQKGLLVKTNPPEIWRALDPKGHARDCRVLTRTDWF